MNCTRIPLCASGLGLQKLRIDLGLRLIDVSQMSGLSISHLSVIENELSFPSLEALAKLANGYSRTIEVVIMPIGLVRCERDEYPEVVR